MGTKVAPIAHRSHAVGVTWEQEGGTWLPRWHRLWDLGLVAGCVVSGLALAQPRGRAQGFARPGGGKTALTEHGRDGQGLGLSTASVWLILGGAKAWSEDLARFYR